MARIHITENKAQWFDSEKAEKFKNTTYWNGNNWINNTTNSQWRGQALWKTATGKFILENWSNYQNELDTFEIISKEHAALWLLENEFYDEAEKIQKGIIEANEV
jgi:hypothetical protein